MTDPVRLDSIRTIYEKGAEAQSSDGASYPGAGKWGHTISQVPVTQICNTGYIRTEWREYLLILYKISPPIDSLSWEATPEQVRIDVTTHDAARILHLSVGV
jgi:hypothetical protein